MFLPQPSSTAQAWSLADYRQTVVTSPPSSGAGGTVTAELGPVPHDELWFLDRVVVQSTSTTETVAFLYLDQVADPRCVDGTRVGNFDVADNNSPLQVPGGAVLICQWRGASGGAVGTMRAQYTVLRQDVS